MAEDGYLPRIFGRQLSTGAPWVSIVLCCAVWTLSLGLSFTKLIVLDVLLTGLAIMLEFASLVALRIREPKLPRPYRVPGGMVVAVGLGIFPLLLLILAIVRNKAEPVGPINALQLGGILIVLGILAYFAGDAARRRRVG
jgi:amino acid transporter